MYSLETLALLCTHDTGRRQTNTKAQHNTTQENKMMSNTKNPGAREEKTVHGW